MSLRQKIENHFQNRSGQGSLVAVIVATVMLSTIVAAGTEWYLSMNKSTSRMQEQMAAQSYAYNEWQNVLAEDYDSLSSKTRKNVSDKFDLKRDVGAEKTISGSGKEKDVVITVYRKGTDQVAYAMQSGKARPTMDDYYTKAQADAMVDKKLKELIRLENIDNNVKIPDGKALYAYLNGQKLPLSSQDGSINYEFLRNQNLRCTISANIDNYELISANGITFYDTTANGLEFFVEGGDQYNLYMYKNNKKYFFMITDDASFLRNENGSRIPIPIYQTTVHDMVVGDPYRIITKMSYSKEDVELWISNFLLSKGYNEPIDFIWQSL